MATRTGTGRRPGWSTQANEIVDKLFAYGTFRAGQPARAMIAGHVKSIHPGTCEGQIYAFQDGYPGMVAGQGTVVGEILELDDLASAFALLDAYEGDDYERTLRQVSTADGSLVWAWTYMLRDPGMAAGGTRIESGDWVEWVRARAQG